MSQEQAEKVANLAQKISKSISERESEENQFQSQKSFLINKISDIKMYTTQEQTLSDSQLEMILHDVQNEVNKMTEFLQHYQEQCDQKITKMQNKLDKLLKQQNEQKQNHDLELNRLKMYLQEKVILQAELSDRQNQSMTE